MNKLSIFFIVIMLLLTTVAVIPMFGMPAITYGYGNYSISLTPAMVIIILSVVYLLITLFAMLISHSVSSHMERSVSSLAEKLANCQYEKNKLMDENKELQRQLDNIKELYEKQLKIIEKVAGKDEKEEEKNTTTEPTETNSSEEREQ